MGGLNIAEKRLPQDGRIRLKIAGKDIDVRLSTVPTIHGERLVMRLLDRSAVLLDLGELGLNESNLRTMNQLIHRSHGIILVTGPTGSGKTTTLYAALTKINTPEINILTVEDPVEYQLPGIAQIHVNEKIDLTFANVLRSFLRQDPDVIMVGEIRDVETAEIAIQASLTGHLVFSTVHTNDAAGAITRLVDMGVEPFLVASSLVASPGPAAGAHWSVPTAGRRWSCAPEEEELRQMGCALEEHQPPWACEPSIRASEKGCDEVRATPATAAAPPSTSSCWWSDAIRQLVLKNVDSNTIKSARRSSPGHEDPARPTAR
jgi:general secretion pathway protein E